jgi:hypothetical protein
MLYVFDESEIKFRQRGQMFGNMHLIVELYKYEQIKSTIITHCIDEMFEEINGQNVEILCQMLLKLSTHIIKRAREIRLAKESDRVGRKFTHTTIDLDWIDGTLQKLFGERTNNGLDTRIRFMIQDIMD